MYFKDRNNKLHVIDEAFTHLLPEGCIEITQEEADAIHLANNPPPDPQIQINADAKAQLLEIDMKSIRALREGDNARLQSLNDQAVVLRTKIK